MRHQLIGNIGVVHELRVGPKVSHRGVDPWRADNQVHIGLRLTQLFRETLRHVD